jgi:hypothetical protein
VLVKSSPSILSLGQLKLDVSCSLPKGNLKVIVLQALGYLEKDEETLVADFAVIVLKEVDDVLGHAHVQTGLDFV